jgi:uncharacterized phiE125 gp8 family phage protein
MKYKTVYVHEYISERVTAATQTPIDLVEAKQHLRVSHNLEDELINGLIEAATDQLQVPNGYLNRALVTQTWKISVQRPDECGRIYLPCNPVQSITAFEYYDENESLEEVTIANFHLFKNDDCAYLEPKDGFSWPTTFARQDAIQIEFTCGYGDPSDVPQPIKQAIKLLLTHWYENRSNVVVGTTASEIPMTVEAILGAYKLGYIA